MYKIKQFKVDIFHTICRIDIFSRPLNITEWFQQYKTHKPAQCPTYYRIRGDILGTYYESINNIVDKNSMDSIINYALTTKRLMKDEDKDNTGVT